MAPRSRPGSALAVRKKIQGAALKTPDGNESPVKPITINPMSSPTITVERLETKETTIKVKAATPEEAFDRIKSGEGREIGSVKKSELVIRDYPEESSAKPA